MGISLQVTALDPGWLDRVRALGPLEDEQVDAVHEELERDGTHWGAYGDGKSWAVVVWALTGGAADRNPLDAEDADTDLSEWVGLVDAARVPALAEELAAVDEAAMRERLARTPDSIYLGPLFGAPEHHDRVVRDARELAAFVADAARAGRGLVLLL